MRAVFKIFHFRFHFLLDKSLLLYKSLLFCYGPGINNLASGLMQIDRKLEVREGGCISIVNLNSGRSFM